MENVFSTPARNMDVGPSAPPIIVIFMWFLFFLRRSACFYFVYGMISAINFSTRDNWVGDSFSSLEARFWISLAVSSLPGDSVSVSVKFSISMIFSIPI